MDLFVVFLAFLTTVLAVVLLGSWRYSRRETVRVRLDEIRRMEEETQEEDVFKLPFMERVTQPLLDGVGNFLGRVAPKEIRARMEKQILYSGNPWKINFNGLLAIQIVWGVGFLLLAVAASNLLQLDGARTVLLVLIAGLLGWLFPLMILNSRAESRKGEIQKNLPDMLDMLLVSVEAGLGFDMALKRVAEQMPGVLSQELHRTLEEIRMGSTREQALRGMARRTGVADLSSFISAVIQAEQLGSNIAGTLRVQADSMRQKRRQRVEEAAMKAPIKLLFPLLIFVFPALFVVILGPAALSIMEMFQEML